MIEMSKDDKKAAEFNELVREICEAHAREPRPDTLVLPDTPFNRQLARKFRRWHRWRAFWRKCGLGKHGTP